MLAEYLDYENFIRKFQMNDSKYNGNFIIDNLSLCIFKTPITKYI